MKAALDVLEKPEVNSTLRDASIGQLARVLTEKLEGLPWSEIQRLRADSEDDMLRYLIDAQESLTTFLAELDK